MIDIRIDVDMGRDLTRTTVLGQADVDRVIDVFHSPEFWQTSRNIWDYRAASVSALGQESLVRIAAAVRETDRAGISRAFAFVVRNEDAVLLARLYTEISRHKFDRQIQYHITTDIDDAQTWLDENIPPRTEAERNTDRRMG